jgi:hypothetical protein
VNYAKLLEMNSFFTWHTFLEVGKVLLWVRIGIWIGHQDVGLKTIGVLGIFAPSVPSLSVVYHTP